jgi:ribosomal protein S27E
MNKSIHRVDLASRGSSRAERELRCPRCSDTGLCYGDSYSIYACPFCEAGKRLSVEHNAISGETRIEDK